MPEFDRGIRGFKLAKIAGLVPSARMRDGKHGATDGSRHLCAGPFISIIRYRRVIRSISRVRPENSRFLTRKKKQKGEKRASERAYERGIRARGLFAYSRAKRSTFSSGAPISTDRIIHPSPSPTASVSICVWIFHDRAGIYFWNEESFVDDALSTRHSAFSIR